MTRRRRVPRPLAAAAGLALDRLLPEPPGSVHPVVLFGIVMTGLERRIHRDARGAGLLYALAGVALGLSAGAVVRSTALATSSAVAGRALAGTAGEVGQALEADDLERARELLPSLVGRDPSGLGSGEIARAVVESVAENTVDAVVAPAFWGALAGAPGALGYRSVNTLDSMVGHRSLRYANFGWASARLDDAWRGCRPGSLRCSSPWCGRRRRGPCGARCVARPRRIPRRTRAWRRPRSPPRSGCGSGG